MKALDHKAPSAAQRTDSRAGRRKSDRLDFVADRTGRTAVSVKRLPHRRSTPGASMLQSRAPIAMRRSARL